MDLEYWLWPSFTLAVVDVRLIPKEEMTRLNISAKWERTKGILIFSPNRFRPFNWASSKAVSRQIDKFIIATPATPSYNRVLT
jgi:hypothetical protein